VSLSGHLPYCLINPDGSLVAGMLAEPKDCQMMSFRTWCRAILPGAFLHIFGLGHPPGHHMENCVEHTEPDKVAYQQQHALLRHSFVSLLLLLLLPSVGIFRGSLKIRSKANNVDTITQSVQSAAGKVSCNRIALNRCTNTEAR